MFRRRALAAFVSRYAEGVATLVETRQHGKHELIVLDVCTGAPPRPVYPVLVTERVGLVSVPTTGFPFR